MRSPANLSTAIRTEMRIRRKGRARDDKAGSGKAVHFDGVLRETRSWRRQGAAEGDLNEAQFKGWNSPSNEKKRIFLLVWI